MIALILSIVLSTYLVLAFRAFDKYKINHLQAIVINYVVCVITGSVFDGKLPAYNVALSSNWIWIALTLGISFIFFFNMMGWIASNIGITVTSVAGKLSMVIPVTLAFWLYDDVICGWKIVALILSIPAVILSSYKKEEGKKFGLLYLLVPMFLFLGSGFNDTLVQYAQFHFLEENEFPMFMMILFSVAAVAGSIFLLFSVVTKPKSSRDVLFPTKTIIGGILLGIPNYFSLHFLLKALSTEGWSSSLVFPINNIGIVLLTGILAFIIFREKLSRVNLIGLALSVICIVLMIYSK